MQIHDIATYSKWSKFWTSESASGRQIREKIPFSLIALSDTNLVVSPTFGLKTNQNKPLCKSMDYPWNPLGQNTGVGSLSLLHGIFPTQGSNPGLPHCRQILYQLSYKESPRILEWVAYPFSSRSSQPRNRTRVSCIASRFFTN